MSNSYSPIFNYDYFAKMISGVDNQLWRTKFICRMIEKRVPIYNYIKKKGNGGRLLDIGCGLGLFLTFVEPYFETYGIDISFYATRLAKQNASMSKIFTADISKPLSFKNNYFDIVTSFDILEHLKRPEIVIKEIYRVVKPGGVLAISTPNPSSLGHMIKKNKWYGFQDVTHISIETDNEWVEILENHHFNIVKKFYDFLWDFPYLSCLPALIRKPIEAILLFCPTFFLYILGLNYCNLLGENTLIICEKK